MALVVGGVPTALFPSLRGAGHPAEAAGQTARGEATRASTPIDGPTALEAARRALASGDVPSADQFYRLAWHDPASQGDAARELWELHKRPGFSIRADEPAIDALMKQLGPRFRRLETPHFLVLSDAPADWVEERARLLERTRTQFLRVAAKLEAPVIPHQHRLAAVLFNSREDYRAFARERDGLEAEWVAGYYASAANRVVLFNHATSPDFAAAGASIERLEADVRAARATARKAERDQEGARAERLRQLASQQETRVRRLRADLEEQSRAISDAKCVHETVHLLSFNTGLQRADRAYPFWISEGLATAFEPRDPAHAFGPDRPASLIADRMERFDELRSSGKALALDRLVGMVEVPEWDEETAEAMYCQSHALFLHVFRRDPKQLGRLIETIGTSAVARHSPEELAALFAQHLGPVAGVERAMGRASESRARAGAGDGASGDGR
jgi:hypothetical protein